MCRSQLFRLKEYPPEGKPDSILAFLENHAFLEVIRQIPTDHLISCGCRFLS
jgi:hypothetical protein